MIIIEVGVRFVPYLLRIKDAVCVCKKKAYKLYGVQWRQKVLLFFSQPTTRDVQIVALCTISIQCDAPQRRRAGAIDL